MADIKWKSGTLVKVLSSKQVLRVVGYDSVGSVICELIENQDRPLRLYASPSLLTKRGVEH
ncbi:hypothetical protein UP10_41660 [Bradyrhizobium sp. LTSPM299]|jgi:hypothetical protein|nr:hypothetical protein UP10_41660 [Bradyrhizobium sp. LTSPM299]